MKLCAGCGRPAEDHPGAERSYQPPWTQMGSLQQAVDGLRSQLHGKAEKHEVHKATRSLDRIDSVLAEVRAAENIFFSEIAGIRYRLQELEARALAHDLEPR